MALNTTHGCWDGPHYAFHYWRAEIALAAGYNVAELKLNYITTKRVLIDRKHFIEENWKGKWDKPQKDPLIYLIIHSDADGFIYPKEAGPLADRLEELLPFLVDNLGRPIGYLMEKTQKFIDGLRAAVKANQPVVFQ